MDIAVKNALVKQHVQIVQKSITLTTAPHREKVGRVVLPKTERGERSDLTIQVFIVL